MKHTLKVAFVLAAISVVSSALLGIGQAADGQKRITEIVEAGINNCSSGPEQLGPLFFGYVKKRCVGKLSCEVAATDVETEKALIRFGCTGAFVIASCGPGDLQEYSSSELADNVFVFCDGPL